eukprot:CAMPEP_0202874972 /NCGR_PEP_ID=MMETSP1391-20130828/26387_1 /ASSEMBLY_ACC=CAM_ASM_000867 /TAXON_ID=1034604 /ORGANISM="Chlamydomonas leiostraca, Strain SAG 11-49" /LENGTH=30 /DNA_ID= /DNA_START= /DNA_END= /DNA_ORIENTATION=
MTAPALHAALKLLLGGPLGARAPAAQHPPA